MYSRNMGLFKKPSASRQTIELNSTLFEAVKSVMEMRGNYSHSNVDYDPDAKQFVPIVGESNYQEALKTFKGTSKNDVWAYGVLLPEPDNQFDPNAVVLHLITPDNWIEQVGYLPKELAAKVCRPISNHLASQQALVPVLCLLTGGVDDAPSIGVKAWVKNSNIKFA